MFLGGRLFLFGQRDGGFSRRGLGDGAPLAVEQELDELEDLLLIVYEENPLALH